MSIQMQLWSIQGDRPVRLPSAKLDLESRLEAWICQDLSLVGEGLLLLGNQVATEYGHAIDVLALDQKGNLVVLELKRGRTPRDVVAQILDYASWAHSLSIQDIDDIAKTYRKKSLEELYQERFQSELPQPLLPPGGGLLWDSKIWSRWRRIRASAGCTPLCTKGSRDYAIRLELRSRTSPIAGGHPREDGRL